MEANDQWSDVRRYSAKQPGIEEIVAAAVDPEVLAADGVGALDLLLHLVRIVEQAEDVADLDVAHHGQVVGGIKDPVPARGLQLQPHPLPLAERGAIDGEEGRVQTFLEIGCNPGQRREVPVARQRRRRHPVGPVPPVRRTHLVHVANRWRRHGGVGAHEDQGNPPANPRSRRRCEDVSPFTTERRHLVFANHVTRCRRADLVHPVDRLELGRAATVANGHPVQSRRQVGAGTGRPQPHETEDRQRHQKRVDEVPPPAVAKPLHHGRRRRRRQHRAQIPPAVGADRRLPRHVSAAPAALHEVDHGNSLPQPAASPIHDAGCRMQDAGSRNHIQAPPRGGSEGGPRPTLLRTRFRAGL